jgi:hypothetical protein
MQKYISTSPTPDFQPLEESVGLIMARLAKRLAGPAKTPAELRLQKQAMEFERVSQLARLQNAGGF